MSYQSYRGWIVGCSLMAGLSFRSPEAQGQGQANSIDAATMTVPSSVMDTATPATLLRLAEQMTQQQARHMHQWESTHLFAEASLDTAQGSLTRQLATIARQAVRRGLTVVVDVGGPGCVPCFLADSIMHLPVMQPVMQKMYVVHLDIVPWERALTAMHADVEALPQIFALDASGRLVPHPWKPGLIRYMLRDLPDTLWTNHKPGDDGEIYRLSLLRFFEAAQSKFAHGNPADSAKTDSHYR